MSMNQCVSCDKWYKEDKAHPCICPDCQKELDDTRKLESEEEFWYYLENKFKEVPECPLTR